ncbi:MAG TPA: lipocalin-like domain-containing protein [Steroidobacteraceae bacterium]|nr:lipocalin-like domain-containing protein [Steroidobacteraceae bacterium]
MRYTRTLWSAAALAVVLTDSAHAAVPPDAGVVPAPAASPGQVAAPAAPGFAQALSVRPFIFPRDHGPHPAFRQEWWYVTGNLDAADGERFGFELTFFRFALVPPEVPLPAPARADPGTGVASAWRSREIYLAHFAVTDVARGRFRFAQKLERGALGLAGALGEPLHVWIDDWTLGGGDAVDAAGATRWPLHATQQGYAIDLELAPQTPAVPNGENGLSRKADEPTAASYYYSIPRLDVRGRVLRDGRALTVSGTAWLDREWGSGELGVQQSGWDWFALQLNDGSTLMFYALRRRDGSRDRHSAGTWLAASGETRPLADLDVSISVTREWRNARGDRYPAGWHIRVPSLALDLSVRPVLQDQELGTTPRYWEGAVDVSGQRDARALGGRGYVELVGYAAER